MNDGVDKLKWQMHHLQHLVGSLEFIQYELEEDDLNVKAQYLIEEIDKELNSLLETNNSLKFVKLNSRKTQ